MRKKVLWGLGLVVLGIIIICLSMNVKADFLDVYIDSEYSNNAPGENVEISIYVEKYGTPVDSAKVNYIIEYSDSGWNKVIDEEDKYTNSYGYYNFSYTLPNLDITSRQYRINGDAEKDDDFGSDAYYFYMRTYENIEANKNEFAPGESAEISANIYGPNSVIINTADVSINVAKYEKYGTNHIIKIYYETDDIYHSMNYKIVNDTYTNFDFVNVGSYTGGSEGRVYVQNPFGPQIVELLIDDMVVDGGFIDSDISLNFYESYFDFYKNKIFSKNNQTTDEFGYHNVSVPLPEDDVQSQKYRAALIRFDNLENYYYFFIKTSGQIETDKDDYGPGETAKISAKVTGPYNEIHVPNADVSINIGSYIKGSGGIGSEHILFADFDTGPDYTTHYTVIWTGGTGTVYLREPERNVEGYDSIRIRVYNEETENRNVTVYLNGEVVWTGELWGDGFSKTISGDFSLEAKYKEEHRINNVTTNEHGFYNLTWTVPLIKVRSLEFIAEIIRFGEVTDYVKFDVKTIGTISTNKNEYAPGEGMEIAVKVMGPDFKTPVVGADISVNIKKYEKYGSEHELTVHYVDDDVFEHMNYIVINNDYFTFTFQKKSKYSGGDHGGIEIENLHETQEIELIINNIVVDSKYVEKDTNEWFYFYENDFDFYKIIHPLDNKTTGSNGFYNFTWKSKIEDILSDDYIIELIRFNEIEDTVNIEVKTEEYLYTDKEYFAPGEIVNITARITGPEADYPVGGDVSINITSSKKGGGLGSEHILFADFNTGPDYTTYYTITSEGAGYDYVYLNENERYETGTVSIRIRVYNYDYIFPERDVNVYLDGKKVWSGTMSEGSSYTLSETFSLDEEFIEVQRINNFTIDKKGCIFTYLIPDDVVISKTYKIELIRFNETMIVFNYNGYEDICTFTVKTMGKVWTDKERYIQGDEILISAKVTGPEEKYLIEGADLTINLTFNNKVIQSFLNKTTNSFGIISLNWKIPAGADDGEYTLKLIRENKLRKTCTFFVKAMNLEIKCNKYGYIFGEKVIVYYNLINPKNGESINGATIKWEAFTNDIFKDVLNSDEKTGQKGSNSFEIDTKLAKKGEYKIWVNASVGKNYDNVTTYFYVNDLDANLKLNGIYSTEDSAIEYSKENSIEIEISSFVKGSTSSDVKNANVDIKILKLENGNYIENVNLGIESLKTDENGKCLYIFDYNGKVGERFKVVATITFDKHSTKALGYYFIGTIPSLFLDIEKEIFASGENVIVGYELNGDKDSDLQYYYQVDSGSYVIEKGEFKGGKNGTFDFMIPENFEGSYFDIYLKTIIEGKEVFGNINNIKVSYASLVIVSDKMNYIASDEINVECNLFKLLDQSLISNVHYFYKVIHNNKILVEGDFESSKNTSSFKFTIPSNGVSSYYDIEVLAYSNGHNEKSTITIYKKTGIVVYIELNKDNYFPDETVLVNYKLTSLCDGSPIKNALITYCIEGLERFSCSAVFSEGCIEMKIPGDITSGDYILNLKVNSDEDEGNTYTVLSVIKPTINIYLDKNSFEQGEKIKVYYKLNYKNFTENITIFYSIKTWDNESVVFNGSYISKESDGFFSFVIPKNLTKGKYLLVISADVPGSNKMDINNFEAISIKKEGNKFILPIITIGLISLVVIIIFLFRDKIDFRKFRKKTQPAFNAYQQPAPPPQMPEMDTFPSPDQKSEMQNVPPATTSDWSQQSLTQQQSNLPEMQICPFCNAQVPNEFSFCNMCGKQIKN